jgi:excisionase family DNA binding protein
MDSANTAIGSDFVDLQRRSVLLDQAAELLGVSRRTVYYRIREGRLTTIRTRSGSQRVLLDSLEDLLWNMHVQSKARRGI